MQRIVNQFVYNHVGFDRMPNPTVPAWLEESYSQCYEDVTLIMMLNAYMLRNNITSTTISYIEIGGNHPVSTSSSYLLQRRYNANGIIVEPDPKLAKVLRTFRPMDNIIEAAVVDTDDKEIEFYVSTLNELSTANKDFIQKNNLTVEPITVKTIRVNDLLEMTANVGSLFLSIDVEGLDIRILKDINFSLYRPHFITIEPSEHLIPGASSEIISYLKEKEYRLVAQNYVNLMFEDSRKG
jgi:FkbM family methyltransferase